MIYLMKDKCPKCGGDAWYRDGVNSGKDIPDVPDLPWVKVDFNMKRYDLCVNSHYFNIRPYVDYDKHYIYEGKVDGEIARLEKRITELREARENVVR